MNNACPTCGAVYAVAAKDIGRKIRCKKCSTALRVDNTGLVVDAPAAAPPPAPVVAAVVADDFDADDEVVSPRGKKSAGRKYSGGPGILEQIGGVPTILFTLGVFMVIWFTFMTPIGEAAILRSSMGAARLKLDMSAELKKAKDDPEKVKKITEDYAKRGEEATKEAANSAIDNVRSIKYDRYGQMFGFILVAFGCIGYLRTQQPPIMHYVAGVILSGMMLVVFGLAGGCGGNQSPMMNAITKEIGKGGAGSRSTDPHGCRRAGEFVLNWVRNSPARTTFAHRHARPPPTRSPRSTSRVLLEAQRRSARARRRQDRHQPRRDRRRSPSSSRGSHARGVQLGDRRRRREHPPRGPVHRRRRDASSRPPPTTWACSPPS